MSSKQAVAFVFFDIGGTLGERDPHTGKLVPFASTAKLMDDLRHLIGVPMGVITTLGGLSNQDGLALLQEAGLAPFLDRNGFVSEHDVKRKASRTQPSTGSQRTRWESPSSNVSLLVKI